MTAEEQDGDIPGGASGGSMWEAWLVLAALPILAAVVFLTKGSIQHPRLRTAATLVALVVGLVAIGLILASVDGGAS